MEKQFLLALYVLALGCCSFAKPNEEASVKINITVNTDQGSTHESVALVNEDGKWKALKDRNGGARQRSISGTIKGGGYIPEKCWTHLRWAYEGDIGWNKGPGKLQPEANEWYKDMKKQTGVEPRDGSFEDFQRIFKCNGLHASDCNDRGLQFPLTCSYPTCNTCDQNQPASCLDKCLAEWAAKDRWTPNCIKRDACQRACNDGTCPEYNS